MKITIAPVTAGPAWGTEIELTVGLAQSPEGLIYKGTNTADLFPVLDSNSQTTMNRGNQASTITFRFTKDNSDVLSSEEDLIKYFSMCPKWGKVTFYAETDLSTPFAYMLAKLDLSHSQIGLATIRDITLTGGPITTSEPTAPAVFPP